MKDETAAVTRCTVASYDEHPPHLIRLACTLTTTPALRTALTPIANDECIRMRVPRTSYALAERDFVACTLTVHHTSHRW